MLYGSLSDGAANLLVRLCRLISGEFLQDVRTASLAHFSRFLGFVQKPREAAGQGVGAFGRHEEAV